MRNDPKCPRLVSTICIYLAENLKMDVLKVEKKTAKLLGSKILYRNQENVDNAFFFFFKKHVTEV